MKCPYCNQEAKWCENKEKYGKNYGKSYMCYWCKNCDAYVGCHNNTRRALGTMANAELRRKRIETHEILDSLWNTRKERREVYEKLRKHFGKEIHVGESDLEQCSLIIKFLETK